MIVFNFYHKFFKLGLHLSQPNIFKTSTLIRFVEIVSPQNSTPVMNAGEASLVRLKIYYPSGYSWNKLYLLKTQCVRFKIIIFYIENVNKAMQITTLGMMYKYTSQS